MRHAATHSDHSVEHDGTHGDCGENHERYWRAIQCSVMSKHDHDVHGHVEALKLLGPGELRNRSARKLQLILNMFLLVIKQIII